MRRRNSRSEHVSGAPLMYIPPAFREMRMDVLHRIIVEHSFGTFVSVLEGELFATHLPFLLDADHGPNGTLMGHMARANPHWHSFGDARESLVIFAGPHAYVSPSWYVSEVAVPTWNYIAVHVYGVARVIDDRVRVRALLDATVGTFESGLPEPRWSTSRVPSEYVSKMAESIVAFELPISRLEGKRKLSQNRPTQDIQSAAAGLRAHGGALARAVADQMLEGAGET